MVRCVGPVEIGANGFVKHQDLHQNRSTCKGFYGALIMASASLLPPVSPTPIPTCSLAIELPDARIWVHPQRFARCPCPRRCPSPRSPRLSRAPRRMVASEKEPTMSLASFPKAFFTGTRGPALTCLLHVLPGCTAPGDRCARTRLWPPAPSRLLIRRIRRPPRATLFPSTTLSQSEPGPPC